MKSTDADWYRFTDVAGLIVTRGRPTILPRVLNVGPVPVLPATPTGIAPAPV